MKTRALFMILICVGLTACSVPTNTKPELPNILWIVSEDNSPYLGCYGDENATTPYLDKLASEGTLYSNAYANAAVCAPARSTLITGMYASSTGTHNMRSAYNIPDEIKSYSQYLKEAGYYCTNNNKKDYNSSMLDRSIWDESSNKATYLNREEAQPFFAVFNIGITHESKVHNYDAKDLVHDPAKMKIPPYHPDCEEVRNDWAKLYDNMTKMDKSVGKILADLEKSGQAENTIVFYYGDHGGVIPRSKRFLYTTGTKVPLIIRFPEKYKHLAATKANQQEDRIVSFVDFAPTLLSLAGIDIPDHMEGRAFLGQSVAEEQGYAFFFRGRMDERVDYMLSLCNKQYRIIYNFYPERPNGQHLSYLWRSKTAQVWEQKFKDGECNATQSLFWLPTPPIELYDMQADPWEVENLADKTKYHAVKSDLLDQLKEHLIQSRDASLMPESELIRINEKGTIYEYVQSADYPIKELVEVALKSATSDKSNEALFHKQLSHSNGSVRYWSLYGLIRMGKNTPDFKAELNKLLDDECISVSLLAARALYGLGDKEASSKTFSKYLGHDSVMIKVLTINAIQLLGNSAFLQFEDELSVIHDTNIRIPGNQPSIYIDDIIREGIKRAKR